MKDIQILQPDDISWKAYKELRLSALKNEPQAFATSYTSEKSTSNEEWKKRLENYRHGKNSWAVFAGDKTKLVGMVAAFQTEEDINVNSVNMIAMFVNQEARGQGVGKRLISTLIENLKKSSIKKVRLAVNVNQISAIKLYESMGFNTIGTENVKLGDGNSYDEYLMEKELV